MPHGKWRTSSAPIVNILAIETSTPDASVAVREDGTTTFEESFIADRAHSVRLFVSLETAVREASSLDRIAVGPGPGSYAGVRRAIAAAIGLQFARGAELVGVPSVAALDVDLDDYCVIGDARREPYYFTRVTKGICLEGPL